MTEDMSIENYLAAGGVLSNPTNVPPRYRAELMKLMATFVDSELAGAAGFADIINAGPGLKPVHPAQGQVGDQFCVLFARLRPGTGIPHVIPV